MSSLIPQLLTAAAAAALCACHAPSESPALTLEEKAQPGNAWAASLPGVSKAEPLGWLEQFDDAGMRAAVREAVAGNPDLKAAAARMKQARIRSVRDGAARLPEVNAGLRSGQSGDKATGWNFSDDYALSLDVSWEADVWGRVRDSVSASLAGAQAAEADFAAARLSLAANAARAWCNLLEAEAQLALAKQTVETFRTGLNLVDGAQRRGVPDVTALDVRLARSSLAASESNVQGRLRSRDEAQRVLESLLGRYPSGKIATSGRLPSLRREIPAGMPSTLLLRRPDIIAAERRVAAAVQDEKAARKALLPTIRLTGGLRSASPELSDLLNERTLIANLVQSLAQPVYRGGALRAEVALSAAQREELASRYASVALTAFREVETAMAAEHFIAAQIQSQETFVEESLQAEKLALSEFSKGLTDALRLLESQRRAFDSRSGLLRAQNQRLQTRIDLCLALGGGF